MIRKMFGMLMELLLPAGKPGPINFQTLRLGPRPNQYLILPEGVGMESPHRRSAVFPSPREKLMSMFDELVCRDYGFRLIKNESTGVRHYVVRTPIMRFPDYVSVETYTIDEGRSAIAVYSRAIYGYGDFGVNEKRTARILEKLRQRMGEFVEASSD